ncbi:hypothetical protein [Paramaledivibacter caminithermalis]|jgi:uncharacterized membrane protein|uniref:Coat F domain-containing protein n=1 Tax=Paramaledivibacter caminithermalis (strain DSM 15212 / CIP 107654 / DViRD3) TaxID=1121301 RepID=A0A1M6QKK2_PARC5|nr:hypothetical protein [Paramaledivibacter caminithermalis]SHK20695.1 hypothetical protein SAMN02745912_02618 [Paramaledivibacter caminithermalis DSM 15212]
MYSNPKLDEAGLKVLENQLAYEAMMNRKYSLYASYFNDAQLKNLCQKSSNKHKENYNNLLNYLLSHQ